MPSELPAPISPKARQSLRTTWRYRRLSGLRWQLIIVYSILFSFLILLFSLFTYFMLAPVIPENDVLLFIQLAAVGLIIVGVGAIGLLTNMMLRPLHRLSDVAQTIALGDIQQSQRLEPLLHVDDEVGKIASSLSSIADQLDNAVRTKRANEEQSRRFFSDASHQLRTPLTSIRGFTEVLMRGAKDDPETAQRILKLMHIEAERMTKLVNDLLMLARLDDPTIRNIQAIDLVDIAVGAVEHTRKNAPDQRKVSFCLETEERLNIQGDPDHLKQALHILLDNAVKYGLPAPDGWIRLHLDKEDGHATMQIINNGKGIHEKDLPHIFERFYRGAYIPIYTTSTTPPPGSGLGLSIALAIIHNHEGDITAYSEANKETVFTIRLPATDIQAYSTNR